jgi:hypothetical protein
MVRAIPMFGVKLGVKPKGEVLIVLFIVVVYRVEG